MEDVSAINLLIQLLCVIGIFAITTFACKYIVNKVKTTPQLKNSKFLNPIEYFPKEEVHTLRQVFYLIMILCFIVISLYLLFDWVDGSYPIFTLDILISAYLFIKLNRSMDKNSLKDIILLIFLIPIGSLTKIFFGMNVLIAFDLLHIIGYLYYIKVYYRKFISYTENNGLGITIILLFSIILVSFLFTMLVEDVSPLDSIVMVSNAFTSNSFDAAGKSVIGKLDSLVLAWGGFILSGAGTATLAVSIIRRYVDRQFDDMETLIKNKNKEK